MAAMTAPVKCIRKRPSQSASKRTPKSASKTASESSEAIASSDAQSQSVFQSTSTPSPPQWDANTELVGIVFELSPLKTGTLPLQYTTGLHAWFLDQVRQTDPDLSEYLHDGQSEKPFTISQLEGLIELQGRELKVSNSQIYRWYVTGLSKQVVQWLAGWLNDLPQEVGLRQMPLKILSCGIALAPTTYAELFQTELGKTLTLSFITPTSFRRKGHHFPLPLPFNLFHSYLRRWNDFSQMPFEQDEFLAWVDEGAIIHRHHLESVKVAAGKQGSVTGFTGAIELGLSSAAQKNSQFSQLFYALGRLAPYCATGHKTTFGLGQTRCCWHLNLDSMEVPPIQVQLAQRVEHLTESLMTTQKRTGGDRALRVCQIRATIQARREFGESLQDIAADLEMPYETVKTYAKLARQALKAE